MPIKTIKINNNPIKFDELVNRFCDRNVKIISITVSHPTKDFPYFTATIFYKYKVLGKTVD